MHPVTTIDAQSNKGQIDRTLQAFRGAESVAARSRWPELLALCVYSAWVAFAIPSHEPWADEAQAWQLARTLSLGDLFKTFIRYEASPGLWHLLLWILSRAHVSYAGLHWICGSIAVASTALLLFKSPFPRYLRLTLPFTYFLIFQYAVVARNYVLVPPLLFMIAICWRRRPFIVALLLGLMANASLHAAVISGGLAIVFAIEYSKHSSTSEPHRRRNFLLCALIVVALYAFAIWTAFPPQDLSLSRPPGAHHPFFGWAIASLCWGICQPWILSIPFWIAIVIWFGARRKFFYLLPVIFFAIFSGAVYANWWHVGLLVPLLISLLWITWPAPGSVSTHFETIGKTALGLMIATQILWSGYAIAYDHYHAYSPDRAAAEFLRPYVDRGDPIAATDLDDPVNYAFRAIGVLPYFDRNIFINLPYAFWSWSDHNPSEQRYQAVLPSHPRIVMVEIIYNGPEKPITLDHPKYKALLKDGYKFTNLFCGTIPERLQSAFTNCHVIFQYPEEPLSPAKPAINTAMGR
ncbi:MAG: hypothetical protein ABSF53_03635 [Terracidiphilus sp.]